VSAVSYTIITSSSMYSGNDGLNMVPFTTKKPNGSKYVGITGTCL